MPRAASLAASLRQDAGVEVELQPGERGAFEVLLDGVLVFSKKATGQFPSPIEIVARVRGD